MFHDSECTSAAAGESGEHKHQAVKYRFSSKRNCVFLTKNGPENLVVKVYAPPGANLEKEIKMLYELNKKGVAVPRIVETDHESITMEYLDGPLLLDIFERQEKTAGSQSKLLAEPVHAAINSLCHWLMSFYDAARNMDNAQIILGEVNFRNFIFKEKIYGIDFEECRHGRIEEDIGKLCAFALTYAPPFTPWKIAAAGELFKILTGELNLDRERVKAEITKELLAIATRRNSVPEMLQAMIEIFLHDSAEFINEVFK